MGLIESKSKDELGLTISAPVSREWPSFLFFLVRGGIYLIDLEVNQFAQLEPSLVTPDIASTYRHIGRTSDPK